MQIGTCATGSYGSTGAGAGSGAGSGAGIVAIASLSSTGGANALSATDGTGCTADSAACMFAGLSDTHSSQ